MGNRYLGKNVVNIRTGVMTQLIRHLLLKSPAPCRKPSIAMLAYSTSMLYRSQGQRQEDLWGPLGPFLTPGSVRDQVSEKQS